MVVGGAGDCAAGAVGNGIVRPGVLSTSIGTSGVVFVHSETPQVDPAGPAAHVLPRRARQVAHDGRHARGRRLAAMVPQRAVRNARRAWPSAARSTCTTCSPKKPPSRRPAPKACSSCPTSPASARRTPTRYARGAFVGLTLKHSRGHMVRAIMEGVTYSLRDCLAIIEEQGVAVKQIRASGGGANSAFWRQMQADVLGKTVVSMAADEGPAYGVALLAAVGAGEFKDIAEACDATVKTTGQTKPSAAARKVYDKGFPVYQQLYRSLRDDFSRIALLT